MEQKITGEHVYLFTKQDRLFPSLGEFASRYVIRAPVTAPSQVRQEKDRKVKLVDTSVDPQAEKEKMEKVGEGEKRK
jgi:hypothetical protein